MDKLTIKTNTTVLKINTQSIAIAGGSVDSVNGKTGVIVLNAEDIGADQTGAADQVKSQLENNIAQVLALAQTNELKIGTKADQLDLETTQIQVEENRLSILTKADIQALAMLAQLVDTKADQSYVNQQIANLVGSAPEALDTIYELAAAIQSESSLIAALNESVANRVRFDIATQALTEIQKQNARTNIDAEKIGTAQQLVSQITAQSLGAATAAQGAKADTALQSSDVAPVAFSGLFTSLASQNKIFDVVFNAYALGSNTAISATDTLGQMLGKLQAQVTNSGGGASSPVWVDVSTVGTVISGYVTAVNVQVARFQGMLWFKGIFNINSSVGVNSELCRITASAYKPYVYSTSGNPRLITVLNGYNMSTVTAKPVGCSALGNIISPTQASSVDVVFEAKASLTTTDVTINIPPTIIGILAI